MINSELIKNTCLSKADLQAVLLDILQPLEIYFESSKFGLKFDTSGVLYDEQIQEIEALLRPLWGVLPLLAGGGEYPGFSKYMQQIKSGTNPESENYWGQISGVDQRMVEMAVLGVGLCLAKEKMWDVLSSTEQIHLYNWLNQINKYNTPKNNWRFFRVLINLGFKKCGQPFNEQQIADDLSDINSFYLKNGWYSDGNTNQIDYYIPFAFHFYSLLYVKIVGEEDTVYAPLFKLRAVEFAQTFRGFFEENGAAVPFGRSVIYRFAQSAFWGALAFADVEALPWGELKHLCLQNLRYWLKQDIFTVRGELTIGYQYRNQVIAEGYNAFGSPYWALKSFIFLALPDDHAFWTAEETIGNIPNHLVIPEARMILQRDSSGNQVQLFTVGQHCQPFAHAEAKYEKFVYSSVFGFSVPKGYLGLAHGAFDNTLAVSENEDNYYRTRYGVEEYKITENYLFSVWKPWNNVTIKTYIIPFMPWHVRIHFIDSRRQLILADGGFAINGKGENRDKKEIKGGVAYCNENQISSIIPIMGEQTYELVRPEPNTNLMYPNTILPTLKSKCESSKSIMASAVLGAIDEKKWDLLDEIPEIEMTDFGFIVSYMDKQVQVII